MPSLGRQQGDLLNRELDPEGSAQRREVRTQLFHLEEIPRQRALVLAAVSVLVWLHVVLIPHGGLPEDALLYTGLTVVYAGLAALVLRAASSTRAGAHAALQAFDVLALALAVWFTGAEESWLFLLPVLGVTELTHTTARRAALISLCGVVAYAGVVGMALTAGHPVDPGLESVKLGALVVIALRMAATARAAERERDDMQVLVERSQAVARELEQHSATYAHAQEAMQAARRERNEFLACMSHEIRTPLNGVLGVVELSLAGALSDEQSELMQTARHSTLSLLRVIDDIVDYSALEEGRLELEETPFSLSQVVDAALAGATRPAQEKLLEIRGHVDERVPEWIDGDAERVACVLGKLLENAVEFTDHGQVLVDVEVDPATLTADEADVHIIVSDTGIGIPESKRERIFEPFTQADGTTKRIHGGTGMGLALSAMLVELMGGRLWVESEEGEGSDFHMTLHVGVAAGPAPRVEAPMLSMPAAMAPRRSPSSGPTLRLPIPHQEPVHDGPSLGSQRPAASGPAPDAAPVDTAAPAASEATTRPTEEGIGDASPLARKPSRTLHLLLVEDNKVNQLVARRMLEAWGHEVEVAENGQRGLEALQAQTFDAVLMDIAMPVMDGFEATRKVRLEEQRRGGHLPILAMTAHASPGDRQRCLDGGMDDYLTKPVKPARLFEALERVAEALAAHSR